VNDELLLGSGVGVTTALDSLKTLILNVSNIASGGGDFGRLWNDYLTWVETAEFQLQSLFASPTVWQELYSDRYWHLRDLGQGRPVRPFPLITNEAKWQATRLQAIKEPLERAQQHYDLPPGHEAVVPDTSAFMHYKFYDDIAWPKVIGAKSVRLVVPLLVIEELDNLSFRSNPDSERARKVMRALRLLRGAKPPEIPVAVRKSVDLQILVDPPGHRRRPNNDDEILTRAEYLSAFVGADRVRVAARDYGMQLRASGRGLRWVELPEDLWLQSAE
jgi:hypothetical protein